MTNYSEIIAELAAPAEQEQVLQVGGRDFPFRRPERYAFFRLLADWSAQKIDDVQLAVKALQMGVRPHAELDDAGAFNILFNDGFFSDRGALFEAIKGYIEEFNNSSAAAAYEAGQTPEADGNFSPPGPSESE